MHDVWPSPGLVHYIYIFGGSCPPDRTLPGTKFALRPSLPSPILTVLLHGTPAAGVSRTLRRRTRNGVFVLKRDVKLQLTNKEWNYGTFADDATYIRQGGHHVGHQPTFSLYIMPTLRLQVILFVSPSVCHILALCRTMVNLSHASVHADVARL